MGRTRTVCCSMLSLLGVLKGAGVAVSEDSRHFGRPKIPGNVDICSVCRPPPPPGANVLQHLHCNLHRRPDSCSSCRPQVPHGWKGLCAARRCARETAVTPRAAPRRSSRLHSIPCLSRTTMPMPARLSLSTSTPPRVAAGVRKPPAAVPSRRRSSSYIGQWGGWGRWAWLCGQHEKGRSEAGSPQPAFHNRLSCCSCACNFGCPWKRRRLQLAHTRAHKAASTLPQPEPCPCPPAGPCRVRTPGACAQCPSSQGHAHHPVRQGRGSREALRGRCCCCSSGIKGALRCGPSPATRPCSSLACREQAHTARQCSSAA